MANLGRSDNLDNYMKVPREEGDGYLGGLEVFHQLHCLVSGLILVTQTFTNHA